MSGRHPPASALVTLLVLGLTATAVAACSSGVSTTYDDARCRVTGQIAQADTEYQLRPTCFAFAYSGRVYVSITFTGSGVYAGQLELDLPQDRLGTLSLAAGHTEGTLDAHAPPDQVLAYLTVPAEDVYSTGPSGGEVKVRASQATRERLQLQLELTGGTFPEDASDGERLWQLTLSVDAPASPASGGDAGPDQPDAGQERPCVERGDECADDAVVATAIDACDTAGDDERQQACACADAATYDCLLRQGCYSDDPVEFVRTRDQLEQALADTLEAGSVTRPACGLDP